VVKSASGRNRSSKQGDWTEAEDRRLTSWVLDFIIEFLLPGTAVRDDADHRQFDGGLRVVRANGRWFSHLHQIGGNSLLPLIQLYRSCTYAEAIEVGCAWLTAHPGFGSAQNVPLDDDDDKAGAVADLVREQKTETCLTSLVELTAKDAEFRYLVESRQLPPECWPDSVRRLPVNVLRYGQGAVASLLYQDGVLAGCQLTHVDLDGKKSAIEPVRRTFRRDRKLRGATFGTMPTMTEMLTLAKEPDARPLLIAEGSEDWLSLRLALPDHLSVGLPGIGTLKYLRVAKDLKITIVRDGDAEDSAANAALVEGVDALLLQDALVSVTVTPPGQDANSILIEQGGDALRELVANAVPAELSQAGEIEKAARMPPMQYDQVRAGLAHKLGIRRPTFDRAVEEARRRRAHERHEDNNVPHKWTSAIDPDAAVGALFNVLTRHIRTDEHKLVAVALWIAHAHLVVTGAVNMPRSPRLHMASALPGSGETTGHQIMQVACPRAASSSSTTGPALFRMLGELDELPTLLVDEADLQMARQDNDVLAVLNAGDTRATAIVRRAVKQPDGDYASEEFPVFSPACLFGLHSLPPTLEERSNSTTPSQREEPPAAAEQGEPGGAGRYRPAFAGMGEDGTRMGCAGCRTGMARRADAAGGRQLDDPAHGGRAHRWRLAGEAASGGARPPRPNAEAASLRAAAG
jgi:hypothetical protein